MSESRTCSEKRNPRCLGVDPALAEARLGTRNTGSRRSQSNRHGDDRTALRVRQLLLVRYSFLQARSRSVFSTRARGANGKPPALQAGDCGFKSRRVHLCRVVPPHEVRRDPEFSGAVDCWSSGVLLRRYRVLTRRRFDSCPLRLESIAAWAAIGPENRDDNRQVGGSTPLLSVHRSCGTTCFV